MGRAGHPMRARDYCIVHLKQRHADFDHCSVQACSRCPYLFWTQTRAGRWPDLDEAL